MPQFLDPKKYSLVIVPQVTVSQIHKILSTKEHFFKNETLPLHIVYSSSCLFANMELTKATGYGDNRLSGPLHHTSEDAFILFF